MTSWVPSVEPVSTMTQQSMIARTESRQRRITGASSLTIMLRQRLCPCAFMDILPGSSRRKSATLADTANTVCTRAFQPVGSQ